MANSQNLAHELDRVMRRLEARMHKEMPKVDHARIGPMGGLLLMQLESMQPCSIQALASAMGRDNSQLTRLLRDLEGKGVLIRSSSPIDGRMTLLELTKKGQEFLSSAKSVLARAVDEITAPLEEQERLALIDLLKKV